MKRTLIIALATLASTQALAVGRLADVSITDRDTGESLRAHYHRGEYWVAGRPGAHYALQIRNQQGRRLLAVTSIDGVNVVSGETAAFDQRGYVFDAWSSYDIAGWRKSDSQIAAFTFTSIPKSYAARTGRPENIGVIGVALFRERRLPEAEIAASQAYEAPASAAADSAASESLGNSARRESRAKGSLAAPAPSLGTGHGRREHSEVRNVAFEREQSRPDEVIRIRYDSHDNLVAMGVIRRAPPRQPQAFPDSPHAGYVPDP